MRATWILLLTALVGCGPNPTGDWLGTVEFTADDGESYFNELSVDKEGTATATLYFLGESTTRPRDDTIYIFYVDFDATWEEKKGVVDFDLTCEAEGCAFTMSCEFNDEDGMGCDMTPDFYLDDAELLQWAPVEE